MSLASNTSMLLCPTVGTLHSSCVIGGLFSNTKLWMNRNHQQHPDVSRPSNHSRINNSRTTDSYASQQTRKRVWQETSLLNRSCEKQNCRRRVVALPAAITPSDRIGYILGQLKVLCRYPPSSMGASCWANAARIHAYIYISQLVLTIKWMTAAEFLYY